ncbi:GspE/PulE family protein [Pararobbsia silviterrae]|uniref:Type II/IV secretion system protein n=1 Tax=Pararobbsia silviterrae TaxID=1792498 RepID=A0A494XCE5_9BURK|nr:GspE/PulE family protein [Pararobbsia silviterrae]RKP48527.1 type II/IV secretion system protein [Pararobbsia silviterrae]
MDYDPSGGTHAEIVDGPRSGAAIAHEDVADSPAARLLGEILRMAAERRASDIHVEPEAHGWRVRLRVDGVLHAIPRPAPTLLDAVATRIKVLSRIDIAERRIPQDGRLRIRTRADAVDEFRVSTLPTLYGEKIVLRRLDTLPDDLSLRALGFDADQARVVVRTLDAPHGLVLVTGPTGSGKTISLYAFMHTLDRDAANICTVEDPAELELSGISQVPIREKAGLTFAVALRALLRQDPDVIMIGEIRDRDTADVAVKAAQTGHLVLSTLHTNDAPSTLARLVDIGIEPHHLAAAIRLVTAQRLVRRLCDTCKTPYRADRDIMRAAGYADAIIECSTSLYRASGCDACHRIGYRGRIGIHQVMPVGAALRQRIAHGAGAPDIAAHAAAEGLGSLRDAALVKVLTGETSLDAALRATEFDL